MDMVANQENTTQRVVKKLKEDQTFVFRQKGNKKQRIFNDHVKDHIVATAKPLELMNLHEGPQWEAIDKAKEEVKQGLDIITARQKQIKGADHSEYGWATVDEYEQDQLEVDEEDAWKRLRRQPLARRPNAKSIKHQQE